MTTSFKFFGAIAILIASGGSAISGQFVVELSEPLKPPSATLLQEYGVKIELSLASGSDSYAVFNAVSAEQLDAFLTSASVPSEKISEVLFVNSPQLGGGIPSDSEPKPGHEVFVIERPIPGVGFFGLEKKRRISQNSLNAMAKLGEIIEWDKSYLTSDGTYCLYRADSSATLREHGALAGAPIGKITPVEQITFASQ